MSKAEHPQRVIKPPTYLEAAAPILLLIVLVVLAQVLFGGDSTSGPFQIALIVCASRMAMTSRTWARTP
jgi:hypothetical protein